ncbi:MAG: cytochrome c maturation protein CcmE [Chloroflexi bacterium]|nr:cytochrome c maturation protein CcmE [Chloroflexota bacterium]
MKLKLIVAALVLIPVIAHFVYAIAVSPAANYYLTVDEYAARSASTNTRIGGVIAPGTIKWDNATQTMRFQLVGDRTNLAIVYRGRVPDAFRDNVTAILEGARAGDGSFLATTLMIKCPHQYLPAGF